jgi:hypothetical protein
MLLVLPLSAEKRELLVPEDLFSLCFNEEKEWTLFIAELSEQKAYLSHFSKSPLQYSIIREFEISSGKQKGAKRSEWDLRTPIGCYQILQFRHQNTLQEKFGTGAFILDYPNLIDRALNKSGSGIWIHGTDKIEFIDFDSEGCIRMKNNDINFLKQYLAPRKTPVFITDKISLKKISTLELMKSEWEDRYNNWISAQNNNNLELFFQFYHPAFQDPDMNMDLSRWMLFQKENGLHNLPENREREILQQGKYILVRDKEITNNENKKDGVIETLWKLHDSNWFIIRENRFTE